MNAIFDYVASYFTAPAQATEPAPAAAKPEPTPLSAAAAPALPKEKDVSICYTRGDTMWVLKLSTVKRTTDRRYLEELREDVVVFLCESYSPEDCENGQLILEEIEKKLAPPAAP